MKPYLCFVALFLLLFVVSGAQAPTESPTREERLAKGVFQVTKDEFVLLTSKQKPKERLALLFTNFAKGQASYQWYYFNPLTDDWVSGAGRLQEVYDKVQTGERGVEVITVPGHNTKIQAGGIGLEWSRGNEKSGWIYFRPEHLKFEALPAKDFRNVVNRSDQSSGEIPANAGQPVNR